MDCITLSLNDARTNGFVYRYHPSQSTIVFHFTLPSPHPHFEAMRNVGPAPVRCICPYGNNGGSVYVAPTDRDRGPDSHGLELPSAEAAALNTARRAAS
jgi:hypothetical protein